MKKTTSSKTAKNGMPVWVWIAGAVLVLVILGGVLFTQLSPKAAAYPLEISVEQAAQKREQGAFVLDVRQPEEWTQQHIPGATLIPLGELAARVNEVPKGKEVVVVCRSGNRSKQGRDILLQAGFSQATSMAGGVNEWKAKGLPVVSGE